MKISPRHSVHYRSRPWFPFFILGFGIIMTLASAYYVDQAADTKDRLLFDRSVLQTKEAIDKRLDTYIALLRAGSGLFATQQEITREEFRHYVSLLQLDERYRGIQGIGYTIRVAATEKELLEASMRAEGYTDFSIYPNDLRPEYYAIIYIEPVNKRNQAALGYDMFTERTRRIAMEQARDTAQPFASGKVRLVQETEAGEQPGFLIYMPVYASTGIPKTVEERRNTLRGYMYSPFRAYDFFSGIFGDNQQYDIDLFVYDGEKVASEALLYSREGKVPQSIAKKTNYSATTTLQVAGRTWTLQLVPNARFVTSFERGLIPFMLSGGFFVSFSLYLLSRWQYAARIKAENLAAELYQSREELRHSEKRLRRLVDANIIGVIFSDASGQITEANDAFLKIIGYTKKDMEQGKVNWIDLTPPEYRHLNTKGIREMRKSGVHKPFEKEYIRKDGSRVPVLVGSAYVNARFNGPRPINKRQGIGFIIDLTEQKKLERQKDEFISIASHELKTPVTSLKAYAQVLIKRFTRQGDKDAATQLVKMDAQLDRLTNLIKELLDITKIEAGKLQLKKEAFDMNVLVKEIVEEMQRTTERHTIHTKGKVKTQLYGDRERIGQVLINLLSNAIKYSPDSDTINVFLKNDEKAVTIRVQDFGVGIPKEVQKKVFDRFFRVSGEKEGTFPGLGLGLYISAEIVKRQGGTMWVESALQKGSTFCFTIPIKKERSSSV